MQHTPKGLALPQIYADKINKFSHTQQPASSSNGDRKNKTQESSTPYSIISQTPRHNMDMLQILENMFYSPDLKRQILTTQMTDCEKKIEECKRQMHDEQCEVKQKELKEQLEKLNQELSIAQKNLIEETQEKNAKISQLRTKSQALLKTRNDLKSLQQKLEKKQNEIEETKQKMTEEGYMKNKLEEFKEQLENLNKQINELELAKVAAEKKATQAEEARQQAVKELNQQKLDAEEKVTRAEELRQQAVEELERKKKEEAERKAAEREAVEEAEREVKERAEKEKTGFMKTMSCLMNDGICEDVDDGLMKDNIISVIDTYEKADRNATESEQLKKHMANVMKKLSDLVLQAVKFKANDALSWLKQKIREMQKLKRGVRYYVRINDIKANANLLYVALTTTSAGVAKNLYNWDNLFPLNSSQSSVFEEVGFMCDSIFPIDNELGKDAFIMAYGTSGAGKSYTMVGKESIPGQYDLSKDDIIGIIPRSAKLLFEKVRSDGNISGINVKIYEVIPYLDFDPNGTRFNKNELLKDNNIKIFTKLGYFAYVVKNLLSDSDLKDDKYVSQGPITSERFIEPPVMTFIKYSDFLKSFQNCLKKRDVQSTTFNQASSRSHLVISMQPNLKDNNAGTIYFLDLAGSEASAVVMDEYVEKHQKEFPEGFKHYKTHVKQADNINYGKNTVTAREVQFLQEMYWRSLGINLTLQNIRDILKSKQVNPKSLTSFEPIPKNLDTRMAQLGDNIRKRDLFSKFIDGKINSQHVKVLTIIGLNPEYDAQITGTQKFTAARETLEFFFKES